MSDLANHKAIYRILIALDALQENNNTLEFAVALAARKQAELMTLFIEDLNLAHFASLPFASEIDRLSTIERKLDSLQMARSFRMQAEKVARLLEQMTREKQVNYSLKVVRGHYMQEALSATDVMDVLFLNRSVGKYGKHTLERTVIRGAVFTEYATVYNAVYIIYKGTTASDRALSLACDLASFANRGLIVMIQPAEDIAVQLQQQAASIIAPQGIPAQYLTFPPDTKDEDLVALLQGRECGILVLSAADGPDVYQRANLFLDELQRPVVLVR